MNSDKFLNVNAFCALGRNERYHQNEIWAPIRLFESYSQDWRALRNGYLSPRHNARAYTLEKENFFRCPTCLYKCVVVVLLDCMIFKCMILAIRYHCCMSHALKKPTHYCIWQRTRIISFCIFTCNCLFLDGVSIASSVRFIYRRPTQSFQWFPLFEGIVSFLFFFFVVRNLCIIHPCIVEFYTSLLITSSKKADFIKYFTKSADRKSVV